MRGLRNVNFQKLYDEAPDDLLKKFLDEFLKQFMQDCLMSDGNLKEFITKMFKQNPARFTD